MHHAIFPKKLRSTSPGQFGPIVVTAIAQVNTRITRQEASSFDIGHLSVREGGLRTEGRWNRETHTGDVDADMSVTGRNGVDAAVWSLCSNP